MIRRQQAADGARSARTARTKTAIFNDPQSVQYRQIADSVDQVTRRTRGGKSHPATVEEARRCRSPGSRSPKVLGIPGAGVVPGIRHAGRCGGGSAACRHGRAAMPATAGNRRPPQHDATAAKGDPLDPEVFNRRYFGQQQAEQEATR